MKKQEEKSETNKKQTNWATDREGNGTGHRAIFIKINY